jgi:hypothetical protein
VNERIQFISHQKKQILLVDFSNCSAVEVEKIARAAPDAVTAQPRGSVLLLADFTGASVDHEALRAMAESAVFAKPYIKKSPWDRSRTRLQRGFARNRNVLSVQLVSLLSRAESRTTRGVR